MTITFAVGPGFPGRSRPGAVEPVLGAGAVDDVGDAADHVAGRAGIALRGGAVRVGDVVGREVRIGDRRHPVELVGERDLLADGGEIRRLLCREVVGEVVEPAPLKTGVKVVRPASGQPSYAKVSDVCLPAVAWPS